MSIALAEDLINLTVVNGEDKSFELRQLVKDKTVFRAFVTSIIGDSYKLYDRLKADLRLFYSRRIFQVQLGIILNYQKKYIWERWKEKKEK